MRLHFAPYTLDLARQELRREGVLIAVEPQVFSIISYLAQHGHRLVSRQELMDAVWPDKYPSDATLGSRIMAARRALNDNGQGQRYIRTARGTGYCFVPKVTRESGTGTPSRQQMPSEPPHDPLVGRSLELGTVIANLRVCHQNAPSAVAVMGSTGIGKTALLRAAESFLVEELSRPVLWLCLPDDSCLVTERIAVGSLVESLRALAGLSVRDSDESSPDWASELRRTLYAARHCQPIVAIDGFQAASAELRGALNAVLYDPLMSDVRFLIACRSDDLRAEPSANLAWIDRLIAVGLCGIVNLGPLECGDAAKLCAKLASERGLGLEAAHEVRHYAGGHPRLARFLADELAARGLVVGTPSIPQAALRAALNMLQRLPEKEGVALAAIANKKAEATTESLSRYLGATLKESAGFLATLIRVGVLLPRPGNAASKAPPAASFLCPLQPMILAEAANELQLLPECGADATVALAVCTG